MWSWLRVLSRCRRVHGGYVHTCSATEPIAAVHVWTCCVRPSSKLSVGRSASPDFLLTGFALALLHFSADLLKPKSVVVLNDRPELTHVSTCADSVRQVAVWLFEYRLQQSEVRTHRLRPISC